MGEEIKCETALISKNVHFPIFFGQKTIQSTFYVGVKYTNVQFDKYFFSLINIFPLWS